MLRRSARPVASRQGRHLLGDRHRFAGQRGLGHRPTEAASISRASAPTASPAASSSTSPGTRSRAAMALLAAVAQHPHLQGRELAQRRHRTLGAPLLVGADQRVDQHHAEDHRRVAPVAHASGQRRRDEQDVDQRALELAQEEQEDRALRPARASAFGPCSAARCATARDDRPVLASLPRRSIAALASRACQGSVGFRRISVMSFPARPPRRSPGSWS